ncbi:hypothetical protein EX30DRAFT_340486 [Ascodesmis nigricans]|uniref:Uncharacterized protein n=1 Tax=Ascodesmis nigricans TaxID=341454 RepID=A0A4S2MY00_9PEZI|nr:hypothetical protein EX30DRAFT_340486 [Ascodesmis nigricans]
MATLRLDEARGPSGCSPAGLFMLLPTFADINVSFSPSVIHRDLHHLHLCFSLTLFSLLPENASSPPPCSVELPPAYDANPPKWRL